MPSAIAALSPLDSARFQSTQAAERTPDAQDLEVRAKFQEFTAGTFYKTMLKALRSAQHKPAYLHGGQAEDIFQSHLDDRLSNQLADQLGDQFSGPLFSAYTRNKEASS